MVERTTIGMIVSCEKSSSVYKICSPPSPPSLGVGVPPGAASPQCVAMRPAMQQDQDQTTVIKGIEMDRHEGRGTAVQRWLPHQGWAADVNMVRGAGTVPGLGFDHLCH